MGVSSVPIVVSRQRVAAVLSSSLWPELFAEDWILRLADAEVSSSRVGCHDAESDSVWCIFREGNEERCFKTGSVVIVKQLESFENPLSDHQLAVDVDLPGVPVPVWANQRS